MVQFWVPGIPKPGGSKRAFFNKNTGRASIVDACDNRDWKADVKAFAEKVMQNIPLMIGPLSLRITFYMPRPKGHYGTGRKAGVLKLTAPNHHTSKPDTTKLIRSLEDALKGVVWHDDSQVSVQYAEKLYAHDKPGASVQVERL